MPSPRSSVWIRAFLLATLASGCGSSALDSPPTNPSSTVKAVKIIGTSDSLYVGQTYHLTAADQSDRPILAGVVWTSLAPAIATVSDSGLVTARGVGVASIDASLGSLHGDMPMHVGHFTFELRIGGIVDAPLNLESFQLTAKLFTTNGILVATPPVTWKSSQPAVASVDASGLLVARAPGNTIVTATADSIASTVSVNIAPLKVAITPDGEFGDTLQVAPGQSLQLGAYQYSAAPGNLTMPTGAVAWSSSGPSVATVSQTGVVTGVAAGATTITANVNQSLATRTIRVVATSGTTTIRLISADDAYPTVTFHPNVGVPSTLAYGASSQQVIPAGTLQLSFDGIPLSTNADPWVFSLQDFVGFIPAGTHETFIAVTNPTFAPGIPAAIARFDDRIEPVPADSSVVRVLLATYAPGFNVFFTDRGAKASVAALRGCYLDGPFVYTDYSGRGPGDFDIVLLGGKGLSDPTVAPEVARFPVSAAAGHAMTFVLTGSNPLSLKVLPIVDR